MRTRRGGVAAVLATLALLASGLADAPATAAASTRAARKAAPSRRLFDPSYVHEISFEVASSDLERLETTTDQRVVSTITIDGTTFDRAGLRLKRGGFSYRGLDGKAGFSVKLDEFVAKQDYVGIERFSLGNAVGDPSFVSEHVAYEVFRRAGIPAPRTALADVTLNGELYGLYVMREAYDKEFLARHFSDPEGNLYEAPHGADLSSSALEPRSNERTNDKADVKALEQIVAGTPDEQYVAALRKVVDLPKLYKYWAAESVTAQWDGYLSITDVPFGNTDPSIVMGNTTPNNYYAYHDPTTDKFVVLPWSAETALGNLDGFGIWWDTSTARPCSPTPETLGGALTCTLSEPKSGATMVVRLARLPGTEDKLRGAILAVVDRAWPVPALLARADQLAALVRANGLHGTYEVTTLEAFEAAYWLRRQFIESRPDAVRQQLGAGG
jgi:hypothetical protein